MTIFALTLKALPQQPALRQRPTRCPLWVINGHRSKSNQCPLYPRKRASDLGAKIIRVMSGGSRRARPAVACRVVLFARILRGNLRQRAPVLSQRLIERPNILFIDGVCFFLAFPRILKAFPDHGACPFIVQKHKHRSVGPQSWCHVQILS